MTTERRKAEIGDLGRARAAQLEAGRNAPMSERPARVHHLGKQMSAIKGAAAGR